MGYASGTAGSAGDLVTALVNACTANGWTLSSGVLSKGSVHVRPMVAGTGPEHVKLEFGATAGFASPGHNVVGVFPYINLNNVWPVFYRVFVNTGNGADTVVLAVQEADAVQYKYLSFGNLENKVGAWNGGEFIAGTHGSSQATTNDYTAMIQGPGVALDSLTGGSYDDFYNAHHGAMFAMRDSHPNFGGDFQGPNTYLRCDLDGGPILTTFYVGANPRAIDAMRFAKLPLARGVNLWNGEATLVPINMVVHRASTTISRLGSIGHLRYCRMDNYETADIITLGEDRWMLLPIYKRDNAAKLGRLPDFNGNNGHSGTLAYAIKYDGP